MTSRGYTTQSAKVADDRRTVRRSAVTPGRAARRRAARGVGLGGLGSSCGEGAVDGRRARRGVPARDLLDARPPRRRRRALPLTRGADREHRPGSLAAPGPRCVRRRRQELLRPRLPADVRETEEVCLKSPACPPCHRVDPVRQTCRTGSDASCQGALRARCVRGVGGGRADFCVRADRSVELLNTPRGHEARQPAEELGYRAPDWARARLWRSDGEEGRSVRVSAPASS